MATGSTQFRTAAEWANTSAFTFSTTNSSLNSYVTSTSQIPTKATLKGALKTGYTMTITNDSTYLSNQLVPNSAVTWVQKQDPILDVRYCYFYTDNTVLYLSGTTLYNYTGAYMRTSNFGTMTTQPNVEYLNPAGTIKISNLSSFSGEYWLQLGYYIGATNTNQLVTFWFKIRISSNSITLASTECYVDMGGPTLGGSVYVNITNSSGQYLSNGYLRITPISSSYSGATYLFSSDYSERIPGPVLSSSWISNTSNRSMEIESYGYISGISIAYLYSMQSSQVHLIPYGVNDWNSFLTYWKNGEMSNWRLIIN